jgi:hypothetical protein
MDLLGIILYSFVGVLLLGLTFAIWLLIDTLSFSPVNQKKYRSTRQKSNHGLRITNNNYFPVQKNQGSPPRGENLYYLERELLTLLSGDKALATRLLVNIRFKNPQRSKSWCYEKVIYDLKRDRGGI